MTMQKNLIDQYTDKNQDNPLRAGWFTSGAVLDQGKKKIHRHAPPTGSHTLVEMVSRRNGACEQLDTLHEEAIGGHRGIVTLLSMSRKIPRSNYKITNIHSVVNLHIASMLEVQ